MSDFRTDPLVEELVERLMERRVIPFAGAGVSANAGLPGWDELVSRVASALGISPEAIREKRDLLVAIEYLMIQGKDVIPTILADILEWSKNIPDPPEPIKNIARLDAPAVYTTNWDDLQEEAYKQLGKPYTSVAHPTDLTKLSSSATPILKYHGSIHHPNTMVISESQYYERFGIDSPFDLRLRADMMEYHMLFLGYSFRDYNVRYIWNRTQKLFGDIDLAEPRCAFFVATRTDPIFHAVLEASNIRVIHLDGHGEFPLFMEHLSKCVT
ncbi:SIR2 family protein [Aureliella helgolandensis]|uniref:Uncharacterized protein n=1 Tax=Aureliella helgolandensis TaxID=2527968 RepID=A0A518GBF9_9BACT|nr:SIR2 family protein [Aureliella helgolandensis]QDV25870.1 hypothetical protein Q31a_41980 [Aureliella helgolandensis]